MSGIKAPVKDIPTLSNTSLQSIPQGLAVQTRPSCQVSPTLKLTDSNNTEQPQLMFQRKAVEAFHSLHAQEGTSLTGPSIPTPSSANSKHVLSTITDKETDVHELVEGENSDGQSKPREFILFMS